MMAVQTEDLSVFEALFDKWKNLDETYTFWYFWKIRAGKDPLGGHYL